MTYYILTKRSAPSDTGKLSHHQYGLTTDVWVARAWYRSTRVTDVIEIITEQAIMSLAHQNAISDERLESWREQEIKNAILTARLGQHAHD
jgi:hypothetical protein